MPRKDVFNTKVIDDCYEFLHQVEQGRSSMSELSEVFGIGKNKPESNYRQVERIKQRCIRAGVWLEFDTQTMRFRTERNAKFKYADAVLPRMRERRRRHHAFGFSAEKTSTVLSESPFDPGTDALE